MLIRRLYQAWRVQDLNLVDQTRGILTWVTDNVPGNFHEEVGYATVWSHAPLHLQ